jgi:hypothetical protein
MVPVCTAVKAVCELCVWAHTRFNYARNLRRFRQ